MAHISGHNNGEGFVEISIGRPITARDKEVIRRMFVPMLDRNDVITFHLPDMIDPRGRGEEFTREVRAILKMLSLAYPNARAVDAYNVYYD